MTTISASMVKELREKSGAGMMDCKAALTECGGDLEKAVDFLRKKGIATAAKRAGRATSEGTIQSYIHMGGKIGVMVEVNCETDFVAKTDDFREFAKNIAMHVAATSPVGIVQEDVPQEVIDREGGGFELQSWDWWYYAEKVKKAKYDFDDEALRLAGESMQLIVRVLGGNGLRESGSFERRFRDYQAMPLHINAHPDRVSEAYGRHLLGLPTENAF